MPALLLPRTWHYSSSAGTAPCYTFFAELRWQRPYTACSMLSATIPATSPQMGLVRSSASPPAACTATASGSTGCWLSPTTTRSTTIPHYPHVGPAKGEEQGRQLHSELEGAQDSGHGDPAVLKNRSYYGCQGALYVKERERSDTVCILFTCDWFVKCRYMLTFSIIRVIWVTRAKITLTTTVRSRSSRPRSAWGAAGWSS